MEARPFEIELFETKDGQRPFETWLESLDLSAQVVVENRLLRILRGNFGDSKAIGGQIFELRINCGPGYRVYYGRIGKRVVLLLCGGDKSTQTKDISKAKKYWREFLWLEKK